MNCCFQACDLHNTCRHYRPYHKPKAGEPQINWNIPMKSDFIKGKCKYYEKKGGDG